MSDTDSLYRLSITPPPRRNSQSGDMDHNMQNRFGSKTAHAQSSKAGKNKGDLRNYVQTTKPLSYTAPTAKMLATPPKSSSSTFRMPPSIENNKGKGKATEASPPVLRSNVTGAKQAVDYQAEADAIEERRDLADPDFRVTQDSDTVLVARKKRKESQTRLSPPSTKAKQLRPRKYLYAKCSDPVRKTRDKHIARIQANWGATIDHWMPASILPSTTKKVKGRRAKRAPLEDLKDWNTALLEDLAYLSNSTKDRPAEAYKALQDAVASKNRGGGGPELLPSDVQLAIRRLRGTNTPPADGGAAMPTDLSAEQLLAEATTGMDLDEHAPQLPSPDMSTFGREITIKQEPHTAAPVVRPISRSDGGWQGYDVEVEKLEELDLERRELRAERAFLQQRRRLRELARQHGSTRQDAIVIGAQEGDE